MQQLADEMAILSNETERFPKLLKDTYSETLVEEVDTVEIGQLLEKMTWESSKIIVSGKNLLDHPWVKQQSLVGAARKEKHMGTKF